MSDFPFPFSLIDSSRPDAVILRPMGLFTRKPSMPVPSNVAIPDLDELIRAVGFTDREDAYGEDTSAFFRVLPDGSAHALARQAILDALGGYGVMPSGDPRERTLSLPMILQCEPDSDVRSAVAVVCFGLPIGYIMTDVSDDLYARLLASHSGWHPAMGQLSKRGDEIGAGVRFPARLLD